MKNWEWQSDASEPTISPELVNLALNSLKWLWGCFTDGFLGIDDLAAFLTSDNPPWGNHSWVVGAERDFSEDQTKVSRPI